MAAVPAYASLSDADLASLAAAGDSHAFGMLARRHGGRVRGLVRRMGGSAQTAEDVAQDAFVTAFGAIGGYRGEGEFAGWVCRIAARLYVKQARREARYDLVAETPEPEGEAALDPGQTMDLDAALSFLSPSERLCVTLCSGAGVTHAEAAALLQTPLGTVKSHVARGLDKLRVRLAASTGHQQRSGRHGG